MEIKLAKYSGFCYGVKKAIDMVINTRNKTNLPIYIPGYLVHNQQVIEYLTNKNIKTVSDLKGITPPGIVVIRAHGMGYKKIREIEEAGFKIINATCPNVLNVQKLADFLTKENYFLIVIGEKNHPEVIGITEYSRNDKFLVIEDVKDFFKNRGLIKNKKIGVITQTTQYSENLKSIISELVDISKELRIFNTICQTTKQRQKSALQLTKKVDIMIVVGSLQSANTCRLTELCKEIIPTYQVETSAGLQAEWLKKVKIIGVTAGASTPDWVIIEVINKLKEIGNNN